MKKHMLKLLNLPGLWLDTCTFNEAAYRLEVKVRSPRKTAQCYACNTKTAKIHSYKQRIIKHGRVDGKLILLFLTVRRFQCPKPLCGMTFTESVEGVDRRRTTKNFRQSLLLELSGASIQSASQNFGVSPTVTLQALKEWDTHQPKAVTVAAGTRIGIDEHSFSGHSMALTLTNLSTGKLLQVEKYNSKEVVEKVVSGLQNQGISEVCMDMNHGYLTTVKTLLPETTVTVDRFHVVMHANHVLDDIRRVVIAGGRKYYIKRLLMKGKEKLTPQEKSKLQLLFKQYGQFRSLRAAYIIKEQIRNLYHSRNRKTAAEKLQDIIMLCETASSEYLKTLGRTLRLWSEHILNYFHHKTTNAFTEGVHTKIKMLKRLSFGFRNRDNYIMKIMLTFNLNPRLNP